MRKVGVVESRICRVGGGFGRSDAVWFLLSFAGILGFGWTDTLTPAARSFSNSSQ